MNILNRFLNGNLSRFPKSIAVFIAVLLAIPTQAMEFVVTKTQDSSDGQCDEDCSLREAIDMANQTPGPHIIYLANGTYKLSLKPEQNQSRIPIDDDENLNGDLDINTDLTILGKTRDRTQISGESIDRLFEVFPGAALKLRRLTLTQGKHWESGGAIYNAGYTWIKDVTVRDNHTRALARGDVIRGGAIANYGELFLSRSLMVSNSTLASAGATSYGGALYNGQRLTIQDSEIRDCMNDGYSETNYGSALYNAGDATIARSLFEHNHSLTGSITLDNASNSNLTISNSTIANSRTTKVKGSFDNYDTALRNYGNLTLMHTTITENEVGLINYANAVIRNSIIFGNRVIKLSNWNGFSIGEDFFHSRTFNCRNMGDTYQYLGKGLLVGFDNFQNYSRDKCRASIVGNYDWIFESVLAPKYNDLGELQFYSLPEGSPAIDAGLGSCSSHDQLSASRPQDGDSDGIARCDLGAYEREENN